MLFLRTYNKLVRDNIPDIIRNQGESPIIRVLSDTEYEAELNKKLLEEVHEFLVSGDISELCDIAEITDAILKLRNISAEDFFRLKSSKADRNGGFVNKIYLEKVIDEAVNPDVR